MKKIYCELHMFDLNQKVYIVDEVGVQTCVATVAIEGLPEVISAISGESNIPNVILNGNRILCAAVSEDILEYSKMHYDWNDIKVEVLGK